MPTNKHWQRITIPMLHHAMCTRNMCASPAQPCARQMLGELLQLRSASGRQATPGPKKQQRLTQDAVQARGARQAHKVGEGGAQVSHGRAGLLCRRQLTLGDVDEGGLLVGGERQLEQLLLVVNSLEVQLTLLALQGAYWAVATQIRPLAFMLFLCWRLICCNCVCRMLLDAVRLCLPQRRANVAWWRSCSPGSRCQERRLCEVQRWNAGRETHTWQQHRSSGAASNSRL